MACFSSHSRRNGSAAIITGDTILCPSRGIRYCSLIIEATSSRKRILRVSTSAITIVVLSEVESKEPGEIKSAVVTAFGRVQGQSRRYLLGQCAH